MVPTVDPSKCVILIPVGSTIDLGCEDGLRELERRGYPVWRVRGYSQIDVGRNQMASDALAQGFDELMWIDSDVIFDPNDVEKLRRHNLPLVCGIYAKKASRYFASAFLPETIQVLFGPRGGLYEILHCGFGFVLTRRALYETMRQQLQLPVCNQRLNQPLVPYFAPLIAGDGEVARYLSEDYAFCERARQCGFRIMADTTIRLWHVGTYRYGWEDAGRDVQRFNDFTFYFIDAEAPAAAPSTSPRLPRPPRNPLHEAVRPLPASFPQLRAYCVSYPANHESLRLTLEDFRRSDWGEEPTVFVQPEDWPIGRSSSTRNYKRALQAAAKDGCDFAVILEDDVRVNRYLRSNLLSLPLLRRDQCDYLSLFMPDLIAAPWQRQEQHLGYRLAKPLYAGPNRLWEKHRIWGSQGYVLSRRFILAALECWDDLKGGNDCHVILSCSAFRLPLWYSAPCLVQHAPLHSVYGTPAARAADFQADFRLQVSPGFQPPEEVPGWLTLEEGRLLWQLAEERCVLELGTAAGRATVCLAQQAKRVVTVDTGDQSEAREWVRRYGLAERLAFRQGEVETIGRGSDERFDLVFVNTGPDAANVRRAIDALLPLLAPSGLIAFHDYPDPEWPDVRRVVDDSARCLGWQRIAQANYLGIFRISDGSQAVK